jgi:uncharacterized protein YjbJ (UPF0337 family)
MQMNTDSLKDTGKEMRSQVEGWWGRVTQADLEQAENKSAQLIGLLHKKYGCTHEQAVWEFKRRLSQL